MIELLPSDEQQQIMDSVAEFLKRTPGVSGPSAERAEFGAETQVHREMASLGWFGLGLTEPQGGAGYSLMEEALVAREFGRALAPPSLCAAILGAHVAVQAGNDSIVRMILCGEAKVGLLSPASSAKPHAARECTLFEGQGARLVLFWSDRGMGLYERSTLPTVRAGAALDETIGSERVLVTDAPALAWVPSGDSNLTRRAELLICAQLVGVAEAAKDLAVEYAKVRHQFGQAIGSFQSIKHACAEMAVQCELAYAQTFFAALMTNSGAPDAAFQSAAAGLVAPDAALRNARAGIQIHGGIGFTADCRAHRYLKRAHLLNGLLPPARVFRAECLGGNPSYG